MAVAMLVSCDSPQRTTDQLKKEIQEYKSNPSDAQETQIDNSFAKLNQQIAALEKDGKTDEAAQWKQQSLSLQGDYQGAKLARTIQDAKRVFEGVGEAVKQGAQSLKDAFANPTPEK